MPTWGALLKEISAAQRKGTPDGSNVSPFDIVRRKYLVELSRHTRRNTILYATKWTAPVEPSLVSITMEDVQGLMEVIHGLDGSKGLDLIMHSPGGSPDAAAAVVSYLRSKFGSIRIFVPHAAMSAATMIACAADEIGMGKHSFLGPIDPQMIMMTPNGGGAFPAQAIIDQFEMARTEIAADSKKLGAWAPILPIYGPSLLTQSKNAQALAEELVSEWLETWMLSKEKDPGDKAKAIAKTLADHKLHKSHGRPISRQTARQMGLKILDLEKDQRLQDLVLTVYHATTHAFNGTAAVKIMENQEGKAFVKAQQQIQIPLQFPIQQVPQRSPGLLQRLLGRGRPAVP